MAHWSLQHAAKVAIGVIITSALGGIGYIAWYASKVPDLERSIARHDDKLATISANVILLMSKSEEGLDEKKLKEIISGVIEVGSAKARYIDFARILEGSGNIPIFEWVPAENKDVFDLAISGRSSVNDKNKIGNFIAATVVADPSAKWYLVDRDLMVNYSMGRAALIPDKAVSHGDLERFVAELNTMSKAVSEINVAQTN